VIKFIRPKTLVQLFVVDKMIFGDMQPHIAFEGEVVGRSMAKDQASRSFRINAVDFSGNWDESKAYYYNPNFLVGKIEDTVRGGIPPATAAKANAAKEVTTSGTVSSVMVTYLVNTKFKDLVDAVGNLMQDLSGINIYYKSLYERFRIKERIKIFTSGKIKQFLADIKQEDFLASFSGQQGGLVSLRQMLSNIMGMVFHEFVSVPFPSIVPNSSKNGNVIGSYVFIPDSYSLPPPKCNVVFPNQIVQMNFAEDYRAAPTRFAFRASFPEYFQAATSYAAYPLQCYPSSFSKFMFKSTPVTAEEANSVLGAASIVKSGSSSFNNVNYGDAKTKAVGGVAVSPKLREADFLTNEEAIKGIFLDMETFAPSVTALAKGMSEAKRIKFTNDIGKFLFYKKRFGARNASATLMFNPFIVPGFNAIFIDDSDAGQTFIAKVQSVTHNLTNSGAVTMVNLGYGRDFDEVDAVSGGAGDPPTPAWFDEEIFGKPDAELVKQETDYLVNQGALKIDSEEVKVRSKLTGTTTYPNISQFYEQTVGVKATTEGGDVKLFTLRGVVSYLVDRYRKNSENFTSRDNFVFSYIRRPVPTMTEAMAYMDAELEDQNVLPEEFVKFKSNDKAKNFDGTGLPDEEVIKIRREVIDKYVNLLKVRRGFRG
jgi:hypothetical protein